MQLKRSGQRGQELLYTEAEEATLLEAVTRQPDWEQWSVCDSDLSKCSPELHKWKVKPVINTKPVYSHLTRDMLLKTLTMLNLPDVIKSVALSPYL
jgi:hypothetical protein